MLSAAKHFDPILGIDFHILIPPGAPIPHPFIGFLLDPFDYLPVIGATVFVNGVPRAQAGTMGIALPKHVPLGGSFAAPPANECEMFMGSSTVAIDGDAFSYHVLPAISCHDIGFRPPARGQQEGKVKSMVLPTSIVLPIPTGAPVEVGGAPTISLFALAFAGALKLMGKGLGKLAKTGAAQKVLKKSDEALSSAKDKVRSKLRRRSPASNKGCGRPGEPVDVVHGNNVDRFEDFRLPAQDPALAAFVFFRYYDSRLSDQAESALGRGFSHRFQRQLRARRNGGWTYVDGSGEVVDLPPLGKHRGASVSHDGVRLWRLDGQGLGLRDGEEELIFSDAEPCNRLRLRSLRWRNWRWLLCYDPRGCLKEAQSIPAQDIHPLQDSSPGLGTRPLRLLFQHDARGHLLRIELAKKQGTGRVLASYEVDREHRLVSWTDGLGHRGVYTYDAGHRMMAKTDRCGYTFHYAYDEQGRCVHSWGEDGLYDLRLDYQPEAGITFVTWSDGGVWIYLYDPAGALIARIAPDGGSTRWLCDQSGQVIAEVAAAGSITELLYDEDGHHTWRRDPFGNLQPPTHLEPHPPDPLAYELPSTPLEWQAGALLRRATISVERVRRAEESTETALPAAQPPIRYDAQGRALWRSVDDASRKAVRLDAEGNVCGLVDAEGCEQHLDYASWQQLAAETDAQGNLVRYGWNARQEITRVVDPLGAEHRFELDRKDRIVAVHRDGELVERYSWNRADGLQRKLDSQGNKLLELESDEHGQLRHRRLACGEEQSFTYDSRGRLSSASTAEHEVQMRWSEGGLLLADQRDGQGVEHRYDERGAWQGASLLGEYEVERHRLGEHSWLLVDPAGGEHRLHREPAEGRLTWSLDTALGQGPVRQQSTFDHQGRCLRRRVQSPGDRENLREYRYSATGNLLHAEDSRWGTTHYVYDRCHRLVGIQDARYGSHSFTWDAANNLLAQPGLQGLRVGRGHRLESAFGHPVRHNERLSISHLAGPEGALAFVYDSQDRLVRCQVNGEPWEAAYDPLGRRVRKRFQGLETHYYWDDFRLLAQRRCGPESAAQQAVWTLDLYVYPDPVALVPLLLVRYSPDQPAGRVQAYDTDHLGVPLRLLGSEVQELPRRSPFGVRLDSEQDREAPPQVFPGHLEDPELGLFYNRFRYYHPRLGRYIQPDPLGIAGGLHLYAYPANPLQVVDLDGLHPKQGPSNKSTGGKKRTGPNSNQGKKHQAARQPAMAELEKEYGSQLKKRAQEAAKEKRNEVARFNQNNPWRKEPMPTPSKTTVAIDTRTGKEYVDHSGMKEFTDDIGDTELRHLRDDEIAPALRKQMPDPPIEDWPVPNCAEFWTVNKALLDGAEMKDLVLFTVKTMTGQPMKRCRNCQKSTLGTNAISDMSKYLGSNW